MDLRQLVAKLDQIENNKLYEGLTLTETKSVMLWESAGRAIREAALTPDQIEQLFTSIEQGTTAAGGNRTMLGKGKDAADAVNKAWEDLKTKIQNSGPIKNVDSTYDSVVSKIEAGLGGPDNAVSKMIMKYREFAKKHPVAQGFIYAALIAAAGISGAGLGGAAVLGLLKMADKLLQGEKFSSAAYSGAKTGAMAYAAGQIGKAIRGDQAPAGGATDAAGTPIKGARGLADEADRIFREKVANGEVTDYNSYQQGMQDSLDQALQNAGGKMSFQSQETARMILKAKLDNVVAQGNGGQFTGSGPEKAAELIKQLGGQVNADTVAQQTSAASQMAQSNAASSALNTAGDVAQSIGSKPPISVNLPGGEMKFADRAAYDAWQRGEKLVQTQLPGGAVYSLPGKLSESQISLIIAKVVEKQKLKEGIMDTVKGAAGKAANWAATKGKNLTTKITADKLLQAWKKAGSPTDSEEVAKILQDAGVDPAVISKSFSDMSLPAPSGVAPARVGTTVVNTKDLLAQIMKLTKAEQQQVLAHLKK